MQYYNIITASGNDGTVNQAEKEPIKIRRRGEDNNKLISLRIKEDTLSELCRIAAETNYSRSELINVILSCGIKNLIIE